MKGYHRSINHAETYYNATPTSSPSSDYVSRRTQYQVFNNATCPFAQTCCISNGFALLMDTGYRNARILGVNTVKPYLFRKQATCAPLHAPSQEETPFNSSNAFFLVTERQEEENSSILQDLNSLTTCCERQRRSHVIIPVISSGTGPSEENPYSNIKS